MTDFATPVASCPPARAFQRYWTGYVRFDGRASRSEYWLATLFTALIAAGLVAVVPALTPVWALATLLPSFAVWTRRLRDAGRLRPGLTAFAVNLAAGLAVRFAVPAMLAPYGQSASYRLLARVWTRTPGDAAALWDALTRQPPQVVAALTPGGVTTAASLAAWAALLAFLCRPSKP